MFSFSSRLKKTFVGSILSFGFLSTAVLGQGEKLKKPNLVFLLLDDLDTQVTTPYLGEVLKASYARILKEGVRFKYSFAPTPVCCPARATILSGKYAHNTGVLRNGGAEGGWEAFKDDEPTTLAVQLQNAGYRTGAFGKYLNGYKLDEKGNPPVVPPGWNDWHVFVDRELELYQGYGYHLLDREGDGRAELHYYGSEEADYSTDVLSGKLKKFMKAKQTNQPFFAYVAITAPHFPLPAAKRHEAMAANRWLDTLPTDRDNYFSDGDSWDDKPFWLRSTVKDRSVHQAKVWNHLDWERRLGSLYAVDEMIEAIISELTAQGQWDNTILIITSDNGYNLGAHALAHKMAPYEESIRVPLWILAGDKVQIARGQELDAWSTQVDFLPTLLDAAGVKADPNSDGRSLLPLIRGRKVDGWRNETLVEYGGGGAGHGISTEVQKGFKEFMFLDVPRYQGVRFRTQENGSERHFLFVRWLESTDGKGGIEREFYDIDADPYQLDNLLFYKSNCPEVQAKVLKAEAMLDRLGKCKGKECW